MLPVLYGYGEVGKRDLATILFLFSKWNISSEKYIRHYTHNMPNGFKIHYLRMFNKGIKELDYYALGTVLIDTSFYHYYKNNFPNVDVDLPVNDFPAYLDRLCGMRYDHSFSDNVEAYTDQSYFVTHIVFAAMHYGNAPIPNSLLMNEVRAYLEREFDTVRYDANDIDLLAEFVHCLKALGQPGQLESKRRSPTFSPSRTRMAVGARTIPMRMNLTWYFTRPGPSFSR